jgi:hypothetical protein
MIATLAQSNIEETLATLNYANQVKAIKNKPQVNQELLKTTLIKEIDKLKQQLSACHNKNGSKNRFFLKRCLAIGEALKSPSV